jgi:hypothetical protein
MSTNYATKRASITEMLQDSPSRREIKFLSKPFKTKQLAEKARSKFPERERKKIDIGVIRVRS